jgi:chemotaxis protein methyltransferase CheR
LEGTAGGTYRGDLTRLLKFIHEERGFDFAHYRPQYVERRVAARLRSLNLHTYRQYRRALEEDPAEIARLLDTLTINVTDFFRDATVYRSFRERVIPQLIEDKVRRRQRMIRAWSAGCATGEEPYSIAMSLAQACARQPGFIYTVFGTDLDVAALERAKEATYDEARGAHIPRELALAYTQPIEGTDRFAIKPEVANKVKFRKLDLFQDDPVPLADIIFCRNVFIYFTREQQARVTERFWASLQRGGYLVLGRSEKLAPALADRLELVDGRDRIYRKPLR